MSNQNSAQNTAAQKNQIKKSAHKTKLEINAKFKTENLSLNGVFKFLNKEKSLTKTWLIETNLDLIKKGKSPILFEDLNLVYFLEKIKPMNKVFKGDTIPYLNPNKVLFSPSFVLDGFKLIANL